MARKHYVIGAGISGILTALRMIHAGLDVEIISNAPDPRRCGLRDTISPGNPPGNQVFDLTTKFPLASTAGKIKDSGSSLGGGPTRMASSTEGDVYLGSTPMYPHMIDSFGKTVSEGGWLDRPLDHLSDRERGWIENRKKYDQNQLYIDRLRKFYFDANCCGIDGWRELKARHGTLFQNTDFRNEIIRSFDQPEKVEAAISKYSQNGQLGKVYYKDEISQNFPHLKTDEIHAVMSLNGCSFNVHQFMIHALNYLRHKGAHMRFNTALTDIKIDKNNAVEALVVQRGDTQPEIIERPQHVSLHLGAYDTHNILDKTPAKGKVMGVAGLWMRMKKPSGMHYTPMKIHIGASEDPKRPLTDINAIPCGDEIILGSGYAYGGLNLTEETLETIYECIEHGVKSTFADQEVTNSLERMENAICARSFTYDDLPLLETMKTAAGGKMVITGGDNTGTTSMAPAMARLVCDIALDFNPTSEASENLLPKHEALREMSQQIMNRPSAGYGVGHGGPSEPGPLMA